MRYGASALVLLIGLLILVRFRAVTTRSIRGRRLLIGQQNAPPLAGEERLARLAVGFVGAGFIILGVLGLVGVVDIDV